MFEGHAWRRITADGTVSRNPIRLVRTMHLAGGDGETTILYHGSTAEGPKIATLKSDNDQQVWDEFDIHLPDGLYLDVGDNVSEVLVIYDDLGE